MLVGVHWRFPGTVNDLVAFLAVAREKSFTKAAAKLGVSQSALSHTIRGLETRLGVRLLTRTTRSVSPTESGDALLSTVGPHVDDIQSALDALGALRGRPTGRVRITAGLHVTETILWPKLQPMLREYPDVHVEIIVDYGLANIVADRFDAGVRLGEQVARDMVAVRIGPDFRFVVVGAPSYFEDHQEPRTPQDLTSHRCINLRMPTYGGVYAWEFERGGRDTRQPLPLFTQLRTCRCTAPTVAMGHVWTAPSWQGESSRRRLGRCSHVFGL